MVLNYRMVPTSRMIFVLNLILLNIKSNAFRFTPQKKYVVIHNKGTSSLQYSIIKRKPKTDLCFRSTKEIHSISMHLGHSHDHGHIHDHEQVQNAENLSNNSISKYFRRPILRFLLAILMVFVPALIRKKINKIDILIFILTFTSMSAYDSIRHTIKNWFFRIQNIQKNVLKHSSLSLNKNYFFKNENAADKITLLGVVINILLSVTKFIGGVHFHSAVLVADAGHSLSDLLSDFVTLWAVQIARLPPDEDHPYGHGKFESIGSLFLSMTLIATGLSIANWSFDKMYQILQTQFLTAAIRSLVTVPLPSWPAVLLAGVSIASKEWLFRITKRVGDALNSQIIIANAWHHRSDAFSSVLSMVSIAIAIVFPKLLFVDSAAGILVAAMITLTGLEVMSESITQLTDTVDASLVTEVNKMALDVRGVLGVRSVRARSVGSGSLVDMTVLTDDRIPATAAQMIAEDVRWAILSKFPYVTDVLVHTSAVETYCPLLIRGKNKTVTDLESLVTMLIRRHSDVTAVKKVVVHNINTALVSVESIISVNTTRTLQEAKAISTRLKKDFKRYADIDLAEIYLDT